MRRKRTPRPPAGGRELLLNTQNEYFIIYRYSIRVLAEMRELRPYLKKSTLEGRARGARPDPPPCMYWNEQGGACPLPGVTGAAGTHEASPASA